MALYGAKIFAYTKNENEFDINLERETEEGAVYIHTSRPGVSQSQGPQHERRYVCIRSDQRETSGRKSGADAYIRNQCTIVNQHVITLLNCRLYPNAH